MSLPSQKKLKQHINRDVFGGQILRNSGGGTHAKKQRPIAHGEWLHVCMRSKLARGSRSMLKPGTRQKIHRIVRRSSEQAGVRISSWQNVGNHLHFSVKSPSRRAYNKWIRAMTGLIARAVLGAERGIARETKPSSREPFWTSRPFTRIIRGFAAFDRLALYITKNKLEAEGYSTVRAKEIVRMLAVRQAYLDQTAPIDISKPPSDL
jgi:REP element-mobilizing transposase RayT